MVRELPECPSDPARGRGLHMFLCDALCVTENADDTRLEPLSGGLGKRPDTARSVSASRQFAEQLQILVVVKQYARSDAGHIISLIGPIDTA